ncbi:hypothetical protein [Tissierella sp.]|uniref:hypothetical protein n=1 Tax=Tissierella sp. TaxID=41274 RepID=UPI00306A4719
MIQKVYDILKPLKVPIQYILRPDISGSSKIGISYHFFNEGHILWADGVGKEFGGSLQIDIFSTIGYSSVVNQVKELMKTNKFRFADSWDSDDSFSSVQYYHKILIFNHVEREVLSSGS